MPFLTVQQCTLHSGIPGDCPVCGWPGGGAGGHDDHAEERGLHDPLPGWRILTYMTSVK